MSDSGVVYVASVKAPMASHSHTAVTQLAAFKQPHLHAFSFLCRPMTLKVAAVIFSYTTNMRAAVRTVWSSLASRPLYKPRTPYFLQISGNTIETAVQRLRVLCCQSESKDRLTWFCPWAGRKRWRGSPPSRLCHLCTAQTVERP